MNIPGFKSKLKSTHAVIEPLPYVRSSSAQELSPESVSLVMPSYEQESQLHIHHPNELLHFEDNDPLLDMEDQHEPQLTSSPTPSPMLSQTSPPLTSTLPSNPPTQYQPHPQASHPTHPPHLSNSPSEYHPQQYQQPKPPPPPPPPPQQQQQQRQQQQHSFHPQSTQFQQALYPRPNTHTHTHSHPHHHLSSGSYPPNINNVDINNKPHPFNYNQSHQHQQQQQYPGYYYQNHPSLNNHPRVGPRPPGPSLPRDSQRIPRSHSQTYIYNPSKPSQAPCGFGIGVGMEMSLGVSRGQGDPGDPIPSPPRLANPQPHPNQPTPPRPPMPNNNADNNNAYYPQQRLATGLQQQRIPQYQPCPCASCCPPHQRPHMHGKHPYPSSNNYNSNDIINTNKNLFKQSLPPTGRNMPSSTVSRHYASTQPLFDNSISNSTVPNYNSNYNLKSNYHEEPDYLVDQNEDPPLSSSAYISEALADDLSTYVDNNTSNLNKPSTPGASPTAPSVSLMLSPPPAKLTKQPRGESKSLSVSLSLKSGLKRQQNNRFESNRCRENNFSLISSGEGICFNWIIEDHDLYTKVTLNEFFLALEHGTVTLSQISRYISLRMMILEVLLTRLNSTLGLEEKFFKSIENVLSEELETLNNLCKSHSIHRTTHLDDFMDQFHTECFEAPAENDSTVLGTTNANPLNNYTTANLIATTSTPPSPPPPTTSPPTAAVMTATTALKNNNNNNNNNNKNKNNKNKTLPPANDNNNNKKTLCPTYDSRPEAVTECGVALQLGSHDNSMIEGMAGMAGMAGVAGAAAVGGMPTISRTRGRGVLEAPQAQIFILSPNIDTDYEALSTLKNPSTNSVVTSKAIRRRSKQRLRQFCLDASGRRYALDDTLRTLCTLWSFMITSWQSWNNRKRTWKRAKEKQQNQAQAQSHQAPGPVHKNKPSQIQLSKQNEKPPPPVPQDQGQVILLEGRIELPQEQQQQQKEELKQKQEPLEKPKAHEQKEAQEKQETEQKQEKRPSLEQVPKPKEEPTLCRTEEQKQQSENEPTPKPFSGLSSLDKICDIKNDTQQIEETQQLQQMAGQKRKRPQPESPSSLSFPQATSNPMSSISLVPKPRSGHNTTGPKSIGDLGHSKILEKLIECFTKEEWLIVSFDVTKVLENVLMNLSGDTSKRIKASFSNFLQILSESFSILGLDYLDSTHEVCRSCGRIGHSLESCTFRKKFKASRTKMTDG